MGDKKICLSRLFIVFLNLSQFLTFERNLCIYRSHYFELEKQENLQKGLFFYIKLLLM